MHCGHPVRAHTADDEAHLNRLTAAAPQPLVEKARKAAGLSSERRIVTVLHLDVVAGRRAVVAPRNRVLQDVAPIGGTGGVGIGDVRNGLGEIGEITRILCARVGSDTDHHQSSDRHAERQLGVPLHYETSRFNT